MHESLPTGAVELCPSHGRRPHPKLTVWTRLLLGRLSLSPCSASRRVKVSLAVHQLLTKQVHKTPTQQDEAGASRHKCTTRAQEIKKARASSHGGSCVPHPHPPRVFPITRSPVPTRRQRRRPRVPDPGALPVAARRAAPCPDACGGGGWWGSRGRVGAGA